MTVSDDIVGLAHGMLHAVNARAHTPTGWAMKPRIAVQVADHYGIDISIPEDLTSFLGLPVQVDPACDGIRLLSERPGIRVAHNDPISDAPERILIDLIAELRDIYEDMGGGWELKEATDRAEARLREVTDE